MNLYPLPSRGEVHIRFASLDIDAADLIRYKNMLSSAELNRADSLINQLLGRRFIAARGILRETLAGYLHEAPAKLDLSTGPHGKPFLANTKADVAIRFNLSHTDSLSVLAVTTYSELGIDLELKNDELSYNKIAENYFSKRELGDLFSLPAEQQLAAFYRCWTRKEAFLKGIGSGFTLPADTFSVSLLPDQPPALLDHQFTLTETSRWSITDIAVPPGYNGALAIEGKLPIIQYFPANNFLMTSS